MRGPEQILLIRPYDSLVIWPVLRSVQITGVIALLPQGVPSITYHTPVGCPTDFGLV